LIDSTHGIFPSAFADDPKFSPNGRE